jgi:hypothetical protein
MHVLLVCCWQEMFAAPGASLLSTAHQLTLLPPWLIEGRPWLLLTLQPAFPVPVCFAMPHQHQLCCLCCHSSSCFLSTLQQVEQKRGYATTASLSFV